MAKRKGSKFLEKFRSENDSYLIRPDGATGRPGMYSAVSPEGDPVLVKVWPLAAKKEQAVLKEIWHHELRQLHRLAGYPGAEEYVSTLSDAGSDEKGFYLILSTGQRQPLEATLRRAGAGHWLKAPRQPANRSRIWRNLGRLARGLEILHAQGMLHRNLDAWAVLTAGGEEPDFQLTGFEWSMRLVASNDAASRSRAVRAPFDSFAQDWMDFGLLAATLVGADAEKVSDPSVAPHQIAEHLPAEESRLLKLLARAGQQTRLDGEVVVGMIEQVLDQLAAAAAHLEPKLHLAVRLGQGSRLSERVREASHGDVEIDDTGAQMSFIVDDLAGSPLLVAVRVQSGSDDFRIVLRGQHLMYSLSQYRHPGSPTASWEFAYCESAESMPPAEVNVVGQATMDASSLEVMLLRDANQRFPRLRGKLRSWDEVRRKFQAQARPIVPERQIHRALALASFLEALQAASDIFPVEVLASAAVDAEEDAGVTKLRIRPRPDPDREGLSESLNLRPLAVRLNDALSGDRAADDKAQKEGWRLASSGALGQRDPGDTDWRFEGVEAGRGGPAVYVFNGIVPAPAPGDAFLVAGGSVGRDAVFRRRLKALAALSKHSELLRMLADQRSRILESHDTLEADTAFLSLDRPKQAALRELTATLPFYMVQGPPGVGKTRLVRDLVVRRFAADPTSRLLLSAQSNAALDHLLDELDDVLTDDSRSALMVVRCRPRESEDKDSPFDVSALAREILGKLRASELAAVARASLRARLDLLAAVPASGGGRRQRPARRLPAASRTESPEFAIRALEAAVVRAANVVFATTNSAELERLIEERAQFDWAIVEEAGKATGGELLPPMLLSHRRLMIGDHKQLGPFGAKELAVLLSAPETVRKALQNGQEFVGRLLRDETTEEILDEVEEAESEGNLPALCGTALRVITFFETAIESEFGRQARARGGRNIATRLTVQHRMHPAIADLISKGFYEGLLQTAETCSEAFQLKPRPYFSADERRLPLSPVTVIDMPYLQSTVGEKTADEMPQGNRVKKYVTSG